MKHERFFPPAKAPRSAKPTYAKSGVVTRLVAAARKGGLDPAGIEALPDGTVRLLGARLAPQAAEDLFEQLDREGKL